MLARVSANPFLAPSPLPFEFPDFDAIREEHFAPAFTAGMAEQRAEVDAITADPGAATFDNTIVALERSGAVLRAGLRGVLHARRLVQHPGDPGDRGRDRAAARRALRRDHARPGAVRPHRGPVRGARRPRPGRRSRCGCWSAATATPCGPAPGSAPPSRSGCARSTPSCRRCPPSSARSCWPRRTTRRSSSSDPAELDGLSADAVSAAARAATAAATTAPT